MTRARNEEGSALMMAVIILFIMLGMGTALMATANGSKTSAANQQSGESAYSMAEAALNAQIYALSIKWPTASNGPSSTGPTYGYPTSCNSASNGASYCPSSSDLAAYPSNSQTCPTGTPGDAWSPGPTRSAWTTYVRDAGTTGSSTQQLFTSSTEQNMAAYDASFVSGGSNYVWVRAVGTVNCKTAVVVSQVSMQSLALSFPKLVLNADGFTITNSGNKTIINTQGVSSTTSQISVRCDGNTTIPPPSSCAVINKPSQVSPTTSWQSPPAPSPTLNATQLAAIKSLAQANGTYFPAGTDCSTIGATQMTGSPVYIEGGSTCSISVTGGTINSLASTGFLVLVDGTISFGGNSTYYGVIYGLNKSASTSSIVTLGGTSTVVGGLAVDGTATLSLGSSGNGVGCAGGGKCGDLEFDAAAFNSITGYGGADQTPNTFRQLPVGQ
jgi:Tfp pilus assembly protein PilX